MIEWYIFPFFFLAADPEPEPEDPYVFGPLGSGSGSTIQRHGSGSGSFYRQAKNLTVLLLLFDFLSLKNDVNVHSKSIKQKNFFLN